MNLVQARAYLDEVFESNQETLTLSKQCSTYGIAIYGIGKIGKKVYQQMKEANLKVHCFLDRTAKEGQELFGLPVYRADDETLSMDFKQTLLVAFSIYVPCEEKKSIIKDLRQLGYSTIENAYKLIMINDLYGSVTQGKKMKDKIYSVLELLNDDHSRQVFCNNIEAHYTGNYENTFESKDMIQYFDVDVPFAKGYTNFIDLGAYTGDSMQKLAELHPCETYIGFEPEIKNYELLLNSAEHLREKISNIILFPCATYDTTGFLPFSIPEPGGGSLSDTGSEMVHVVRLDDVLMLHKPTMVKMDIEGAEIPTLKGGMKMIKNTQPDLAVCVYHYFSDLWEIPLMLHEWLPEYRFYFRAHDRETMETVLYATIL